MQIQNCHKEKSILLNDFRNLRLLYDKATDKESIESNKQKLRNLDTEIELQKEKNRELKSKHLNLELQCERQQKDWILEQFNISRYTFGFKKAEGTQKLISKINEKISLKPSNFKQLNTKVTQAKDKQSNLLHDLGDVSSQIKQIEICDQYNTLAQKIPRCKSRKNDWSRMKLRSQLNEIAYLKHQIKELKQQLKIIKVSQVHRQKVCELYLKKFNSMFNKVNKESKIQLDSQISCNNRNSVLNQSYKRTKNKFSVISPLSSIGINPKTPDFDPKIESL